MDAILIYGLIILIVVGTIFWAVYGLSIRRKLREVGKKEGFALDDVIAKGDAAKLGTSLIVANAQAGAPLIAQAISKVKGVTQVEENKWHLRYATPEDLLVVWVTDENGKGFLTIQEAREVFGQLVGGGVWMKALKSISAELATAGVATEQQAGVLQKTDRKTAAGATIWSR